MMFKNFSLPFLFVSQKIHFINHSGYINIKTLRYSFAIHAFVISNPVHESFCCCLAKSFGRERNREAGSFY